MTGLKDPAWYDTVTTFEGIDNSYLSEKYDEFWENRDDDNIDELRERYNEEYRNRRSASQYRKQALTTVMGAFLNRWDDSGEIYERTGWEFMELDPFELEDDVSADILLAKPNTGETMIVILLPERHSPELVVDQSVNGINSIQNNLSQFGYQAEPGEIYGAIVVNPPRDNQTKEAINSNGGEHAEDIFVWRVYDIDESSENSSTDGEQRVLDYFPELDGELNIDDPDLDLLGILEEKVKISQDREILPDFFIHSHHSIFVEHVIGHIVKVREDLGDGPNTHFTRSELEEYIQNTLFEQGVKERAADRAEYLLTRWKRMDLVTSINSSRNNISGDDFYRFTANGGQSQDNIIEEIIDDYQSNTVQFHIEVEAMEEALNAYRDKHGEQATLTSTYTSN